MKISIIEIPGVSTDNPINKVASGPIKSGSGACHMICTRNSPLATHFERLGESSGGPTGPTGPLTSPPTSGYRKQTTASPFRLLTI
jgi:hypothetical protein